MLQQEQENRNVKYIVLTIFYLSVIIVFTFHSMWISSSQCYAKCYSTETQCIVKKEIIPKHIKLSSGVIIIYDDNEIVYTIQEINNTRHYILKTNGEQSDFNLDDRSPQTCYTYQGGNLMYRSRIPLHGSCYMKCNMFNG